MYTSSSSIYSSTLREVSAGTFLVSIVSSVIGTIQESSETLVYTLFSIVFSVILSEALLFISIIYSAMHLLVNRDPVDLFPSTECIESLTDSLAVGCCSTTVLLVGDRDPATSIRSSILDVCTVSSLLYTYIQSNEYYNLLTYVNTCGQLGVFYYITVTHALHVLLGIGILLLNKGYSVDFSREYSTFSYSYMYIATYWHFVEAVWISLLLVFYLC